MEKLFRASLDSFEKRGVTDEDIEKFKGSMESQLINGLQSVQVKYRSWLHFKPLPAIQIKLRELLKMYTSVTKEDVMACI